MSKRRAGRKRKQGIREPNGRLSRATYKQQAIPAEAIQQRARMAPKASEDALRTEGTPLALLRANGDITTTQLDAGEKLGQLWRRWARAASIPPRWPVTSEGGGEHEVTADQWARLKHDIDEAMRVIGTCPQSRFVYTALECVCVDEDMPRHLEIGHAMRPRVLSALTVGLDALAQHFRILPREGQGRAA